MDVTSATAVKAPGSVEGFKLWPCTSMLWLKIAQNYWYTPVAVQSSVENPVSGNI